MSVHVCTCSSTMIHVCTCLTQLSTMIHVCTCLTQLSSSPEPTLPSEPSHEVHVDDTQSEKPVAGGDIQDLKNEEEVPVKSKPVRTKVRTTDPVEGPNIAMEESGLASDEPLTVGAMMQHTVSRVPNHLAMHYKDGEVWNGISYQEYYDKCIAAAKSFLKVQYVYLHVCTWIYLM